MSLRSFVRLQLYRLGLERVRTPGFVDLMRREDIKTVLDVGANTGQYASELRLFGYNGRIVSFEPMKDAFVTLSDAAKPDPLWGVRQIALGATAGEAELNISYKSVFNSFKPISDYTAEAFSGARKTHQETVDVKRLDQLIEAEPDLAHDAYLKIDTQGFEREVINGAGDMLTRFRAVQLELPLRALYENQPLLSDMLSFMESRGFVLAMAKENAFDRERVRLLELDAVFVPKDRA